MRHLRLRDGVGKQNERAIEHAPEGRYLPNVWSRSDERNRLDSRRRWPPDHQLGDTAAGAYADIILVHGNPLEDIRNVKRDKVVLL